MDQENQHSENEYTTQSNLQIQCNPYQATNDSDHQLLIAKFRLKLKKVGKTT